MSAHKLRKTLITTHRYVGLTIGLLVVIVGLSGSVSVVWNEITQLSNAKFRIAQPGTEYAPLQKVLETLHAAHPQRKEAWSVDFPYREDRHSPAWAIYEYPEERAGIHESPLYVAINPYTAEIMGSFYWGSTPVSWVYNLHTMLQLDEPGETVVGVVGIALLMLALSGLYLWWPIGRFTRQQFATIAGSKGPRYEFHLHKLFGFYSSLVLLVVAVTGIIIVWPQASSRAADVVQTVNVPIIDEFEVPSVQPVPGATPIPFDSVLATALELFPGAELRHASMPSPGGRDPYGVTLKQRSERYTRMYPETRVWVNQYTGEVAAVVDPSKFTFSRSVVGYNRYTFHNGSAFGPVGSTVMVIAGLLPLFLYYTGIRQWLRTRKRPTAAA
jgi:uncharacterized iron-regulated membrane protein